MEKRFEIWIKSSGELADIKINNDCTAITTYCKDCGLCLNDIMNCKLANIIASEDSDNYLLRDNINERMSKARSIEFENNKPVVAVIKLTANQEQMPFTMFTQAGMFLGYAMEKAKSQNSK